VGVTPLVLPPESSGFDNNIRRASNKWTKGNCADLSAIDGKRKQEICSVISGQRMSQMRAENTSCLKYEMKSEKKKMTVNLLVVLTILLI